MIELVTFDEQFLDLSYVWLTDKELIELVDGPKKITRRDQILWFEQLQLDQTYKIWGIKFDGSPIGACGIKHIDYSKLTGEYWGYIGDKSYWGGKGHDLMQLTYSKAYNLGLKSIYLNVLKTNKRALQLYISEGFSIISKNEKMYQMLKTLT